MEFPKRKPNRLSSYDYSQNGAYFITICTYCRRRTLSYFAVGDGFPVPQLMPNGNMVNEYIQRIPDRYFSVSVEKYTIMPNHIHMLITIENGTGNPSPTIGTIVGWLKYQTTKCINQTAGIIGQPIWQRSYYDHIIRNKQDYQKIWQYIDENPIRWQKDCYYAE